MVNNREEAYLWEQLLSLTHYRLAISLLVRQNSFLNFVKCFSTKLWPIYLNFLTYQVNPEACGNKTLWCWHAGVSGLYWSRCGTVEQFDNAFSAILPSQPEEKIVLLVYFITVLQLFPISRQCKLLRLMCPLLQQSWFDCWPACLWLHRWFFCGWSVQQCAPWIFCQSVRGVSR